jgi:PAS domain S-box-containing protein
MAKNTSANVPVDGLVRKQVSIRVERGILSKELVKLNDRLQAETRKRKLAENAILERLRRCFDLGIVGMAVTSPAKGFIEANDRLCEILGYDHDELQSLTWSKLTHPDDLAADVAQFKRMCAGEFDRYSLNKRFIRKDGRVVETTISVTCLRRPDGHVDQVIGLVLDLTNQRQLETQVQEISGRLVDTERAARDLLRTVNGESGGQSAVPTGAHSIPVQRPTAHSTAQQVDDLSERELDVLKLLAAGYSHKEASERLHISPRTVDSHCSNIMNKLRLRSLSDLIHYAIRHDIVDM